MAQVECPQCRGTGFRPHTMRLYGVEARVAVPCDCVEGERTAHALKRASIPKRYEHCDFENFATDLYEEEPEAAASNGSLEQAKLTVEMFARDYPAGSDAGLLLRGPCGVGKTHLAVAALKDLISRGHEGHFCEYGKLLREIQHSYNIESQATEMSILDPILAAEVLVIDDLGVIKPSDWVRDVIGYILNTRYADESRDLSHRRCTIITTHYKDEVSEPKEPVRDPTGRRIISVPEDNLTDRIGTPTRSRLYEMCRTVDVVAPDFRRRVRQAGRARA